MLRIRNIYQHYINLSLKEKVKKIFLPIGLSIFSLAIYQGVHIRNTYNNSKKLDVPSDKIESGLIKWIDKVQNKVQNIDTNLDVLSILFTKINTIRNELTDNILKENNILNRGLKKVKDVIKKEEEKFHNHKRKILKSKLKKNENIVM